MRFVCNLHPNIVVNIKGINYSFKDGVYQHPEWDDELYDNMVKFGFIQAQTPVEESAPIEHKTQEVEVLEGTPKNEPLPNSTTSKQLRVFASRNGISIPKNLTTKQEQIDHVNKVLLER